MSLLTIISRGLVSDLCAWKGERDKTPMTLYMVSEKTRGRKYWAFFFFFLKLEWKKGSVIFIILCSMYLELLEKKIYFCNHSFLLLILSSIIFYYLFFYFSLWPPKYTLSKTCGKITDCYSLLLLQWWKHLQFWPIAQQLRWDKEKSYNTFLFI